MQNLFLPMAASLAPRHFWTFLFVSLVSLISFAMAQAENQFIYHGFNESKLYTDGLAKAHSNGLLELTNSSQLQIGHSFHPFPFKFIVSSPQSLSFSTNFVFDMVPVNSGDHGRAFVISPSMDFRKAFATEYLGLLNASNDDGRTAKLIFVVELETAQSVAFNNIDGNHLGIDVNSLISNTSAPTAYFSDDGKNKSLNLIFPRRETCARL